MSSSFDVILLLFLVLWAQVHLNEGNRMAYPRVMYKRRPDFEVRPNQTCSVNSVNSTEHSAEQFRRVTGGQVGLLGKTIF